MDNPASPEGLAARGYPVTAENALVCRTRLDEAWRALQREVSSVVASVTAGLLTVDDVADVVYSAALRVLRNPDGLRRASATLDDYSETAEVADSTLDFYFTAAERRRLTPPGLDVGFAGSLPYR